MPARPFSSSVETLTPCLTASVTWGVFAWTERLRGAFWGTGMNREVAELPGQYRVFLHGHSPFSHRMTGAVAFVALILAGCAGPVFVGETVVQRNGATVYSSLDPRLGEVVFPGLYSSLVTEADVSIDGQHVGTVRSGAWLPVYVSTLGRHHVNAKVFLVQAGQRADYIGCFSREIHVSPYYRNSSKYGFWWRVDVYPSPHC